MICTAFILAWAPYAVVSMWSAWGFPVPNLTSIFTRLFAKSASFYNPLIYWGLSSRFRRDVALLLPCSRDARDPVRLQRFRTRADAHRARARLKAHLNQADRKYLPVKEPRAPRVEPGGGSPPRTPPPADKQLFHVTVAPHTNTSSESECERL